MDKRHRVAGHALRREGAAFDERGRLLSRGLYNQANSGHAKCECGALSEDLPSTAARKRWHAEHKASLGGGGDAPA